jgi:hypothetical protein
MLLGGNSNVPEAVFAEDSAEGEIDIDLLTELPPIDLNTWHV